MANDAQLLAALQALAAKLGTTPEQLQNQAENGTLEKNLQKTGMTQNEALQKALSDPKEAQRLLASPQGQMLLRLFGQNNK